MIRKIIMITMTMTRIGNLLVPNNNYVKFEEWLMPILDKMLEEQKNNGVVWTPSKIIHRFHKMSWYVGRFNTRILRQVGSRDQRRVFNILLGGKVSFL